MKTMEPRRGPYKQEVAGSSPAPPTTSFQSDAADLNPFAECRPPALGRLKTDRDKNSDVAWRIESASAIASATLTDRVG
jgi:hypothetical protein